MKALIAVMALLTPCAASAGWSTYQGNSDHTGYVPVAFVPLATPELRWEKQPFGPSLSTGGLAVGNGRVFVTPVSAWSASAPLVALDLAQGQERWRVDFGNVYSVNPPALDGNGRVYVATGNHTPNTFLRAYDAETGAFRWRTAMAAQWEHYLAPTIVGNRVASNGGYYGGIYAMDLATGDNHYGTPLPQCDRMTPVPWRNNWVTLTTRIDIIDRDSGVTRYFPVAANQYSCLSNQTPVILGDVAYFTHDLNLVAMNLDTGAILFRRAIDAVGQVSTDGERLFVVSAGKVSMRDLQGELIGLLNYSTYSLSGPLIVTRTHVIASSLDTSQTVLLDRAGQQQPVVIARTGVLALDGDVLVIGSSDGVRAYNLSDQLFADGFAVD